MVRPCSLLLVVSIVLCSCPTNGGAADIAIVDYADQWTHVDALRQTLDALGMGYDDLTFDLEIGDLLLEDQKVLFLGSMVTNNPQLHLYLDQNKGVLEDFVENGGVVIEPSQADQNEALVDWLPDGLACVRGDADSTVFTIEEPTHPLFNEPHELREEDFAGWGFRNWPTVWERFASQEGFSVLASSESYPVILEATRGQGSFVMMTLAPDKYRVVGNDERTKEMAGLFLENILKTYLPGVNPEEVNFVRGDCNADETFNIADAVFTLGYAFGGGPAPSCFDAADANDDGTVNIADAVAVLGHLFGDTGPLPAPFLSCGRDPTGDALDCERHDPCALRR